MRSFSCTATAALLVVASLSACSAAAPSTSAPVTPSASTPSVAPSPSAPPPTSAAAPTSSPPSSPPVVVGSKPAGIPKTPTDIIRTAGWVEGTITRGGSGPCYGLVTFDGVAYAMHSTAGPKLAKGDHIRARLTPAKLRISCGDGIPVSMGAIQHFP